MRPERNGGAGCQHHVSAAPGLIVDQFPAVAATDRILGQQYIARPQREMLSASGFEIQRAAQCHDQLTDRRGMPIEFPARPGFLETEVTGNLPVRMSPCGPRSRLITPSSKRELSSSPVQMRTHRIIVISLLLRRRFTWRPLQ